MRRSRRKTKEFFCDKAAVLLFRQVGSSAFLPAYRKAMGRMRVAYIIYVAKIDMFWMMDQNPVPIGFQQLVILITIYILIIKDLSRFSKRNSYGLVELEMLRDAGIRIIAIGGEH